jgi:hypothetical protein
VEKTHLITISPIAPLSDEMISGIESLHEAVCQQALDMEYGGMHLLILILLTLMVIL